VKKGADLKDSVPIPIHVGIVQIPTRKCNLEMNYQKAEKMILKAAQKGADIICTQECMLDGYAFDTPEFKQKPELYSIQRNGEYWMKFLRLAQDLGVYLLLGCSLQEDNGVYRNAVIIYSPRGAVIGEFFKVHSTYGNYEAQFYQHGRDFPVFEIDIKGKLIKIGVMICYDRQMPESARILAIRGADIIFNPAATGNFSRGWNKRLIQTRAYENKVFVVSVNHAAPRINGRSFIVNPNGQVIARCWPFAQVKIKKINLALVRAKKNDLHTRRPSVYQGMLEPTN
jgi:N-carbamoylputrescine amidase